MSYLNFNNKFVKDMLYNPGNFEPISFKRVVYR